MRQLLVILFTVIFRSAHLPSVRDRSTTLHFTAPSTLAHIGLGISACPTNTQARARVGWQPKIRLALMQKMHDTCRSN